MPALQLEARNPTPEPNDARELLSGAWRLAYTSNSELIALLALGRLPLVTVGEVRRCCAAAAAVAVICWNPCHIVLAVRALPLGVHRRCRPAVRCCLVPLPSFVPPPPLLAQVTQTIDPLGQTVENRVELQAPLRWAGCCV